jgi:hypothetical protein
MAESTPDSEANAEAVVDRSLGGYFAVHDRPPAYEGTDGHPYTVSLEIQHTGNLRAPFSGYLVFPRWAQSGVGIVGHVETETRVEAKPTEEANEQLGALSLHRVQELLEQAIDRRSDPRSDEPPQAQERD